VNLHSRVRLSLGQVQGESLVCAYHGWQFAAEDGHCQRIPAQPEQRAPKTVCARSYAVMENSGLIWYGERSEERRVGKEC
jgi:phenylpropionate dioxygenase-like ring-hydroxylating dioxygenase large terminal subunit